jgi:F-type H+-transporting ATPase subunit b
MELIQSLGIDYKILIAQLINFAVLVFVLYKFGYKPMLAFLDERKNKIEEGVVNAEKAQAKLEEISEKEKQIVKDAKKEALELINDAKNQADEKRKDLLSKAKKEISVIVADEKDEIRKEKQEIVNDVKKEISSLVIVALEKVLDEKIDKNRDKEIIKKIVTNIEK